MTSVSIVIPVYNEAQRLYDNLLTLHRFLQDYKESYAFDYVIVDDGSSDGSYGLAQCFAESHENVRVIRAEKNGGLGSALRLGFKVARGTYVVTLDSDLSYAPSVTIDLLKAIQAASADIALASAYMAGGQVVNVPWSRRLLSREANRFLSLATNGRFSTLTCMVRAYRSAALHALPSTAEGMEINPELVFAALNNRFRVIEVPARLQWSAERSGRFNWRRSAEHIVGVLHSGLRHRPALWLGIPGLVPGLLPLVIAILLLARTPAPTAAIVVTITLVVQYVSLAIFAGQTATFFGTSYFTRRRQAARLTKP